MGSCTSQLTGWRAFRFFRGEGTHASWLSSPPLSPTWSVCGSSAHQVNGASWAQNSHTAGEHFVLSQKVCPHHSSFLSPPQLLCPSPSAAPFRLAWLSQKLTQQHFPPYEATTGLHHEHFVQSWLFFHPHTEKRYSGKWRRFREKQRRGQRYRVVCTQGTAKCPRMLQPGKWKTWEWRKVSQKSSNHE